MDTDTLVMLLQTTYRNLDIYPRRYEFDGEEYYCILLDYCGTTIHDPTGSTASRYYSQNNPYGVKNEHAKAWHRHNLHFERTQVLDSFDLQAIMSRIIEEAASSADILEKDPREFLLDLGFEEVDTGGGVLVYRLDDPFTKGYLLVYDNEGEGFPSTFADIEMVRYSATDHQVGVALDIKGNDAYAIAM